MPCSTLYLQARSPLGHAGWCMSLVAVVLPGVLCLQAGWPKSSYTSHTHVLLHGSYRVWGRSLSSSQR